MSRNDYYRVIGLDPDMRPTRQRTVGSVNDNSRPINLDLMSIGIALVCLNSEHRIVSSRLSVSLDDVLVNVDAGLHRLTTVMRVRLGYDTLSRLVWVLVVERIRRTPTVCPSSLIDTTSPSVIHKLPD